MSRFVLNRFMSYFFAVAVAAHGWAALSPFSPHRAVAHESKTETSSNKRALLIGVTKYDHKVVKDLQGPGNDAMLMRQMLERRFGFPTDQIVMLAESVGQAEFRPTRANIEREFKRLAEAARAGDQIVVFLAGHGDRQPESDPPDPVAPEPDGIDEIFLPADIQRWDRKFKRVPNAIIDNEIGQWLSAITKKKAYVWVIFDCCHSATMTRGTSEHMREPAPGELVPLEELAKSRERAMKRTGHATRGEADKPPAYVPVDPSEYLVANYACRADETTPEDRLPASSTRYQGLFTYTLVNVLEQQGGSSTPLTYRELTKKVQDFYAARHATRQTPQIEGKGQDRVVLGVERPSRPRIAMTKNGDEFVVNVGDLHGVTPGSILSVHSLPGGNAKPGLLGYVRVEESRPFDSTVVACDFQDAPKLAQLPDSANCEIVSIDYSLQRFRIGVEGKTMTLREAVAKALRELPKAEAGLFELDDHDAPWVIRQTEGGVELADASGDRPSKRLPAIDEEKFGEALVQRLKEIYRARSLVSVAARLERDPYGGEAGNDIQIDIIRRRNVDDKGEVVPRPPSGWVFKPGERISFRITNTSLTKPLEVTLLLIDSNYKITKFFPPRYEVNKVIEPEKSVETRVPPPITDDPPFGPEHLVAIVTAPTPVPIDFGLLTQGGTRSAEWKQSPLAQLLDSSMRGSGDRSRVESRVFATQGARVLSWRTEPRRDKK